jgi:hypothetical protein
MSWLFPSFVFSVTIRSFSMFIVSSESFLIDFILFRYQCLFEVYFSILAIMISSGKQAFCAIQTGSPNDPRSGASQEARQKSSNVHNGH